VAPLGLATLDLDPDPDPDLDPDLDLDLDLEADCRSVADPCRARKEPASSPLPEGRSLELSCSFRW